MMGRYEPGTAGPAVVSAADMVAGHVRLHISCLDRLYLNGYVAKLQTPGGVVYFFHDHRGKPIVSPALFEPIGNKFLAMSSALGPLPVIAHILLPLPVEMLVQR